ncbi:MAG: hypothetical protein ACPGJS_00185 [Flammeovirgaceae bacterium]
MKTKTLLILYTSLLFLFGSNFALQAQKVKAIHVSGKADILVDDSHNIGQIKRQVVELAKINALEHAFGKVIVQGTHTYLENTATGEKTETTTKMNMIANTMVKGEWLETKKSNIRWVLREVGDKKSKKQELWLLCEIQGTAIELQETKADFEAFTKRCDDHDACVSTDFANQESLFLQFKPSVNGYLSVFMEENGKIYRLFPYVRMSGDLANCAPVEADQTYLLFSSKTKQQIEGVNRWDIDEYALYAEGKPLFNRIYVVFSETAFRKPILQNDQGIKWLDLTDFQKWVAKNKSSNTSFQIQPIDITVNTSN